MFVILEIDEKNKAVKSRGSLVIAESTNSDIADCPESQKNDSSIEVGFFHIHIHFLDIS